MPRLTEQDLEKLLRSNRDISIDTPPILKIHVDEDGARIQRVNDHPVKRSKYGNHKVTVDGLTFDSQREYRRFLELRLAHERGEISDLILQPRFTLMESWQSADGAKHRRIEYIGDFSYIQEGKTVVEDVKSQPTRLNRTYRLKMKLLLYQHKDDPNFVFREVT